MARIAEGIILPANRWANAGTAPTDRHPPERAITATPPGSAIVRSAGWGRAFEQSGQSVYVMKRQDLNQRFYEIDGFIVDVNAHGLLEWDARVMYQHPALAFGTDGTVYRSAQDSVNVNPVTDTDFSHWAPLGQGSQAAPFAAASPDLNTLTTGGVYTLSGTVTNGPAGETAVPARLTVTAAGTITQELRYADGGLWIRQRTSGGSWGSWTELLYASAMATGSTLPVGTVIDHAGTVLPQGFLRCDGAVISRTTYADLFAAIGTTWGIGDGSTTFHLPDLRRRATIGMGGTAVSGPSNGVGNTGGAEQTTLEIADMPSHRHRFVYSARRTNISYNTPIDDFVHAILQSGANSTPVQTQSTGNARAHNNMPPSAVVQKLIRY